MKKQSEHSKAVRDIAYATEKFYKIHNRFPKPEELTECNRDLAKRLVPILITVYTSPGTTAHASAMAKLTAETTNVVNTFLTRMSMESLGTPPRHSKGGARRTLVKMVQQLRGLEQKLIAGVPLSRNESRIVKYIENPPKGSVFEEVVFASRADQTIHALLSSIRTKRNVGAKQRRQLRRPGRGA